MAEFFSNIWQKINEFIASWGLADLVDGLYQDFFVSQLPIIQILIFVMLLIIVILGTITFIKKMFKVFMVLAIVGIIIFWLANR